MTEGKLLPSKQTDVAAMQSLAKLVGTQSKQYEVQEFLDACSATFSQRTRLEATHHPIVSAAIVKLKLVRLK